MVPSNSSTAIATSANKGNNYNSTNDTTNGGTESGGGGILSIFSNGSEMGAFNTFNIQQQHDATKTRLIFANDEMSNATYKFPNNSITTTKYKFYNFVFKNLFQQFHRFANCCKLFKEFN